MPQLWPPVHASLVGARHQARGEGCQDASLSHQGQLADGTPYSLAVVADGHGDQRHHRSATGSRLACSCAAELVEQAARDPATDWQRWLPETLADTLPRLWRQRCQNDHWDQVATVVAGSEHAGAEEVFSPVSYGTTLGLVVLTPQWWACAGIGDWNLALISSDPAGSDQSQLRAAVVSTEPPQPGGGEATFSLCMEDPAPLIRQRCQWHHLTAAPEPALALVLTTDGVHKSCLSERDYLVLCHYLAKEGVPETQRDEEVDLQAALAQITRDGVGDDVSVALAALGGLRLDGQLR